MINLSDKKNRILLLAVIDILLCFTVVMVAFFQNDRVLKLYHQQADKRWETNDSMDYSQVSAFFANDKLVDENAIITYRNTIMKKLYDDSYIDSDEGVEKRTWYDTYYGIGSTSLRIDDQYFSCRVIAVSDDFFKMHPIPLKGGTYMNMKEDLCQIVLDENMAWKLFKSSDVTGKEVWVDNTVFTVVGVVNGPRGAAEEQAYGNDDTIYMPFKAYKKFDEEVKISGYEAVIPNPIKNYAYNIMTTAVGVTIPTDTEKNSQRSSLEFGDTHVVENSSRFTFFGLVEQVKNSKYSSMDTMKISYPFWENVARFETDRAKRVFILEAGLLLIPLLTVVGFIIWIYSKRSVVFNKRNKEKLICFFEDLGEALRDKFRKKKPEDEFEDVDMSDVFKLQEKQSTDDEESPDEEDQSFDGEEVFDEDNE